MTKIVPPGPDVLLVEDDQAAIAQMCLRLEREGYDVTVASTAADATQFGVGLPFDVIILDYFLPDGDGEQICGDIRKAGVDTPILMLTARRELKGKISALDGGADDYLTKPFAFDELFARLRALNRRGRLHTADSVSFDGLTVRRETRIVQYDQLSIELSPLEIDLLIYLMQNPDRAISRQELLANVWTSPRTASTNTVDVYIRYLRKKIWGGRSESAIRTVRGVGYMYKTKHTGKNK